MYTRPILLLLIMATALTAQEPIEARYFATGKSSEARGVSTLLDSSKNLLSGRVNAPTSLLPSLPVKYLWQYRQGPIGIFKNEQIRRVFIADASRKLEDLNRMGKVIDNPHGYHPLKLEPGFVGYIIEHTNHDEFFDTEEFAAGTPATVWVSKKYADGFVGTFKILESRLAFYFTGFDLNAINDRSTISVDGIVEVLKTQQTAAGKYEVIHLLSQQDRDALAKAAGAMIKGNFVPLNLRTWHDDIGIFSLRAEFIRLTGTTAELRRMDGTILRVPMDKLSAADQQWINAQ